MSEKDNIRALKIIMNDYCEKVVPNLFKHSAQMSAKNKEGLPFKNEVSYPTHIINAVFTAASLYSFEHLDSNNDESIRNLKLLISVVTLHDVGKYLENKYKIFGGNKVDNIIKYLESDDFKIKTFFPDIEKIDVTELAWLIQNTELWDQSQPETFGHKTSFGKLADYSRLGDKVASLTEHESYALKIFDTLQYHNVHIVQIPKFPQTLIRREFLKALKKYHEDAGAIPFLLYEDGFFYISKEKIALKQEDIEKYLLNNVNIILNLGEDDSEEEPLLNLRIDFQSIDDDSILNFPLTNGDKKKMILTQIIEKLPNAMKDFVVAFPVVPEIQKKLATIVYYLYKSDDFKELEGFILKKKKDDKNKFKLYLIIHNTDEPKEQEIKSQKYKIYAAKQIIENYTKYGSFDKDENLDKIYTKCDEFLNKQLEKNNKKDIFSFITKNISVDFEQTFQVEDNPKDKTELCFLCGTKTDKEYRAGKKYFLQAREFSKRGRIWDNQKNICSVCLIEKDLMEGLFAEKCFKPFGDYIFATLYFDRIFANISYFANNISNVSLSPNAPITQNVQFSLGNFEGIDYIIPYRYFGKEESAKQSNRVNITKQILKFSENYGCKAVLTLPYTLLRTYNEVFMNEIPLKLEMSLEVDKIKLFNDINKKLKFMEIVYEIDAKKGYFAVESYNLFSFIHFVKIKEYHLNKKRKLDNDKIKKIVDVIKTCFGGEIMKIDEIAQKGKELYSNIWGSSYKRTVLMRTALDTIMVSLQQHMTEEELKRFVSAQIYKLMMREEYAKKKDATIYINDFVEALIQYLKEKDWFSVSSLSSVQKYLVDTYEFSLISIKKEE